MMDCPISFSDLPKELHAKILANLTLKEITSKLVRTSNQVAALVQDALGISGGPHNSLNVIFTGLSGAGNTTLCTRVKDELEVTRNIRALNESTTQPLKLIEDGICTLIPVRIGNITANIVQGSTKRYCKSMYAIMGAAQCVVFTVACGNAKTISSELKQLILTHFALLGVVQWIFVINKMDLVHYSEQEFKDTVAVIQKCLVKVMGSRALNGDQSPCFIPLAATDMLTPVTGPTSSRMSWYTGPSLKTALEAVTGQSHVPAVSLVRRFNASVVRVYPKLSNLEGANNSRTAVVSVYVIDGCISVGDHVWISPTFMDKVYNVHTVMFGTMYNTWERLLPATVLEIQSAGVNKKFALPNSYVGLKLSVAAMPCRKFHFVQHESFKPLDTHFAPCDITYRATVVHVAKNISGLQWDGLVKEGYTAPINTLGVRGEMQVRKILRIFDRNGIELDLDQVKTERKELAIKEGEKAHVMLQAKIPFTLTYTRANASEFAHSDRGGRFVMHSHKYSRVIMVGVLLGLEKDFAEPVKQ